MALRSGSGGGICKRIVRRIGGDFLPFEALDSFKTALSNNKSIADDNEIAVDESTWKLQRNLNQGIFAGRHVQFRNEAVKESNNRTWKPNLQLKRLFNYIHGCDIQPKVTIHAVKCIDRAGGINKSLIKTPYYKAETQMGLLWKGKLEGKWVEFWNKEVGFFSPLEEAKIAKALRGLNLPRNRISEKVAKRLNTDRNQIAEGKQNVKSSDRNQIAEGKQNVKKSSNAKHQGSKRS